MLDRAALKRMKRSTEFLDYRVLVQIQIDMTGASQRHLVYRGVWTQLKMRLNGNTSDTASLATNARA